MRFLIFSQYFLPEIGASQVRLAAMTRELVRQGHEVEVVTSLPNHPTGQIFSEYRGRYYLRETWEGIPVFRVWVYAATGAGIKRMFNYFSFTVTSLLGLLRARRPDYLFVESPPLFLSIPAFLRAAPQQIPIIFNVADLWPDSVKQLGLMRDGLGLRLAEALEAWSYRKAAYVNAVTEGIRRILIEQKGVPPNKVLFLPNGVDTRLFRPRDPDRALARELGLEGKQVILYAGTMGYAHGLETALKAMRRLKEMEPRLHLVLIGGGSERARLERMASEWKLLNVSFLDPAPPDYIARLYSIAFAGLVSLRKSPLFEATRSAKIFVGMSSGKPIIHSGFGEGARLVEEAQAGVVVPPEDPSALAEAIRKLAQNREWAARLGQNGRRYVERHLSWSALVSDWLHQLEERRRRGT